MKHPLSIMLALALTLLMGGAAFADGTDDTAAKTGAKPRELKEIVQEIQAPITISGVLSDKLNVVFSHPTHTGIACLNCHHQRKDEERFVACRTCHEGDLFTVMHSNRMGERSCYGCHKLLARKAPEQYSGPFDGCRPCHDNLIFLETPKAKAPAPAAQPVPEAQAAQRKAQ